MKAPWRNLRWFLAYWISRTGAVLGRFIPAPFWYALADPISDVCHLVMRRQRRVLQDNLRRVVGDDEAAAASRQVFRNFARYVIDFYQLPSLSREALCRRIEFHDWRRLNEALESGTGGIFVTLHFGQAELGAGALAAYGHPVSAVAETLDYPPMNDFIQGLRSKLGMQVIPANKATKGVLRCLSRGELLGMMVDVVTPGEGVVVDFLGTPVEFSSAPARLAIRTGARVMPGVVARSAHDRMKLLPKIDFDFCYERTGDEESDVRSLTQSIARSLEGYVRQHPDQWFAFRPPAGEAASDGRAGGDWRLWALKAGTRVGNALPRTAAYAIGRLGADAAYRLRRSAREDVQDNMRHVMGPNATQDSIYLAGREVFRNVARYYVDLIRMPRMNLESMIGREVRLHGFDRLKSRLDAGEGVVVATAHFGNPELAVQVGVILGVDTLVLAEPLHPPAFAELMRKLRSTFHARYEEVSYKAVADSIRHLRTGGCLAITCDRDIQHRGESLAFFGAKTRLPTGAADLAARTDATLLPAYCRRAADKGFDIYFEEPVELAVTGNPREDALVNTNKLLARAEAWIRADPGQWMPLERIWTASEPAVTRPAESTPGR